MQWEYQVVTFDGSDWISAGKPNMATINDGLNTLGKQGWELVSAFDTNHAGGATRLCVFTLKRPLTTG
ncbi:MAG: DUF4177 domain-containing protein [Planctomycetales bacterium]|nr:DUF4177 domain-containing protein [Planctomycetales bacterium]